MRGAIISCAFFSLINLVYSFDALLDRPWKSYQVKYGRTYSVLEEQLRRAIWEKNSKIISLHNLAADKGLQQFRMELNKFSDRTINELLSYRECVKKHPRKIVKRETYEPRCGKRCVSQLPESVDWREEGYVTKVKDQGACGSCWAFSSTGSLEGQVKAKTGKLVSLSVQNLIDCSSKEGNDGCEGGWMEHAFQYIIDNGGMNTERAYPYEARKEGCDFEYKNIWGNCTSYEKITAGSEEDLQEAVANIGPVSVVIDVTDNFMNYRSGIFYDDSCTVDELDHAVLVVGYGSKGDSDYWIVKNSWGSDWGMDGYILMARNQDNQCGIATHAVYPIL